MIQEIHGIEIEYRWIGPGPSSAPTLVFLHEGLGSVTTWRDFPDQVVEATGWGALVYSRWGYGGSSPRPLPWPLDHMEEEAEQRLGPLLDTLGVERTVLWGHSDGATVALCYAGATSDPRLAGVFSVAAHVFGGEEHGLASIRAAARAYEDDDLRERLARHHQDVEGAFRGWADTWLDPEFEAWTVEGYLPGIEVPVRVVQCRGDQYGTLAQVEAIVRRVGSLATPVILEGCGHHPHREATDGLIEETAEFLATLTKPEG